MKELLTKIKEYIEETQVEFDCEWGESRTIEKIISDGDMPEIYCEVLKELGDFNTLEIIKRRKILMRKF